MPKDEDEFEEVPEAVRTESGDSSKDSRAGTASPAKPQGILLTPGTGTTRRKTVSFGATVIDNEGRNPISRSGIPNDCPGKFPSPWTPKVDANLQPTRRTALTKTLEAVRDSRGKRTKPVNIGTTELSPDEDVQAYRDPKSGKEDTNFDNGLSRDKVTHRGNGNATEDLGGDMTVDLNEPHSQSGQFWKSEYERYQEGAKAEMMKLVKYKQLAKSYARLKDGEAINLREKLSEEQQKVADMEERISELVAQIADNRTSDDYEESTLKALARQTALTIQYKDHVEKLRVALQERDAPMNQGLDAEGAIPVPPSTAQALLETSVELKRAREQLKEIGSLRVEMHGLRLNLSAAEKRASRLLDENQKLSEDLARAKSELEKSEGCRESVENEKKILDERLGGLQNEFDNIKALAKSQRREAEAKLRRRYDQLANLKKELSSLKEIQNKAPNKTSGHDEEKHLVVQSGDVEELINLNETADSPGCKRIREKYDQAAVDNVVGRRIEGPRSQAVTETHDENNGKVIRSQQDGTNLIESRIPVLDRSATGSRKDLTGVPGKELGSAAVTADIRRSTRSALWEINNGDISNSQVREDGGSASHPTESLRESISNPPSKSPSITSPFARAPNRTLQEKRNIGSPRPSMFIIPSSPPKQPSRRVMSSNPSTVENRSNNGSSHLSSLTNTGTRVPLPADRMAAAKARLEARRSDKRKAKLSVFDDQKENSRS